MISRPLMTGIMSLVAFVLLDFACVLVMGSAVDMAQCQSYSQDQEDEAMIHYFFQGQRDGVYVEMGALDGIEKSNTLMLHCLGWNGVLIEGAKSNFAKLEQNVKTTRGNNMLGVFYGAVCVPPHETTIFLERSTLINNEEPAAVHAEKRYADKKFHNEDTISREIVTPCKPLSEYFRGIPVINFFSLDIEGAEMVALHTVDMEATKIDILMIEFDMPKPDRLYAMRQLLFNMGYVECDPVPKKDGVVRPVISRSAVFVSRSNTRNYRCPGTNTTKASILPVPVIFRHEERT